MSTAALRTKGREALIQNAKHEDMEWESILAVHHAQEIHARKIAWFLVQMVEGLVRLSGPLKGLTIVDDEKFLYGIARQEGVSHDHIELCVNLAQRYLRVKYHLDKEEGKS